MTDGRSHCWRGGHRAADVGASESEIVDVLVAIGPVVGFARVVAAAPRLATALGYDLDE